MDTDVSGNEHTDEEGYQTAEEGDDDAVGVDDVGRYGHSEEEDEEEDEVNDGGFKEIGMAVANTVTHEAYAREPSSPSNSQFSGQRCQVIQHNYVQVRQQFGDITVKGTRNLNIGGTQNINGSGSSKDEDKRSLTAFQKIRRRTMEKLPNRTKGMVKTRGLEKIMEKVVKGTKWVTVEGNAGEGKTTVGYMALLELDYQGRQVFQVISPEELSTVTMTCSNPVIMLDDIFGDLEFDYAEWAKWRPTLRDLLETYSFDSDDQIKSSSVQQASTMLDDEQGDERKRTNGPVIILVGRMYVLRTSLPDIGRVGSYLTDSKYVVDISERNVDEKLSIWNAVVKSSTIDMDQNRVEEICAIQCPHGFPHVCKMFVNVYQKDEQLPIEKFFESPLRFLNETMSKFIGDPVKRDLFMTMMKAGGEITKQALEDGGNNSFELITAAEHLTGCYLRREGDTFLFDHPSIYDSAACVLGKILPRFVIENCRLSFISQRLRYQPMSDMARERCAIDTSYIEVSRPCADILAKRFADAIDNSYLLHVLSHPACTNRDIIKAMMSKCTLTIEEILVLKDLESGDAFLQLICSNKSPSLLEYLIEEAKVQLTQNNIKDLITGICKFAASDVLRYVVYKRIEVNINVQCNDDGQSPLMIAANTKDSTLVKLIITLGPEVTACDRWKKTAFHYLCENGLLSAVQQFIDGVDCIDAKDWWDRSPLFYACYSKQIHLVKLLLDRNINVNCQDRYGQSPLLLSCKQNQQEIFKMLLDHGASVNVVDKNQRSPLYHACMKNLRKIMQLLLESGAKVNGKELAEACEQGNLDIVKLLFENGASANMVGKYGNPPVYSACEGGSTTVIDYLIEKGASVNKYPSSDISPLHEACFWNKPAAVKCLLQHGAHCCTTDRKNRTPLTIARQGKYEECVEKLLAGGIHARTLKGETELHLSLMKCDESASLELLKAGSKVNLQDSTGSTPLHLAIKHSLDKCFHGFLKARAFVNVQNKERNTPLHLAVEKKSGEFVHELIKAGADVNLQNAEGKTPLALAMQMEYEGCVCDLLGDGSNVNLQDNDGNTPLHLAALGLLEKSVDELLNVSADVNAQNYEGNTPLHLATNRYTGQHIATPGNTSLHLATHCYTWQHTATPGNTPLHLATIHNSGPKFQTLTDRLIGHGAEINQRNFNGKTPLHILLTQTYSKPDSADVELLLKIGVDVNAQDFEGKTPLHTAARRGLTNIAEALLKFGAEVNRVSCYGTPLHQAVRGGHTETVLKLLKAGASVQVTDTSECTPLYTAADRGCDDIVEALLKAGAEVNTVSCGSTPLHQAVKGRHTDTVLKLMEARASVQIRDALGRTPLHLVFEHNDFRSKDDCLEKLIQFGAEVNATGAKGQTPLHKAVFKLWDGERHPFKISECRILLANGARVNAQDDNGDTALHLLCRTKCSTQMNGVPSERFAHRYRELVTLLIDHAADVNIRNNKGKPALNGWCKSLQYNPNMNHRRRRRNRYQ